MIEMIFAISGAVVVILLGLIILRNKKTIFWISFILCFTPLGYLTRFFKIDGPFNLNWFAFFALLALSIGTALFKINKSYYPRGPMLVYIGIALVSILSMLLNYIKPFSIIFPQRGYLMIFAYIALFRTVYEYYDKEDILSFVVTTGMISGLYAVFQRILFVAILKLGSPDMVTGLFEGDSSLNYYQLICLVILIVYWLKEKEMRSLPVTVKNALLITMGTLAFTNDKAVFVYLIILIGVIFVQIGTDVIKKQMPKVFAGVIILSLVTIIFAYYQDEAYNEGGNKASTLENMTNPDYYMAYIFGDETNSAGGNGMFAKGGQLKRGSSVIVAYEEIQKSTFHYILGRGPGSTSQNSMRGAEGELNKLHPGWNIGRTALAWFIAETGMLGLFLQLLFIISIAMWRPPQPEEEQFKIIRVTYAVFSILYITFANLYLLPIFSFLVVVMTYPIYHIDRGEKEETEAEKTSASQEYSVIS